MKKTLLFVCLALLMWGCAEPQPDSPTVALSPIPTPMAGLPPTFTPPQPFERYFPTFPAVTVTQPAIPTRPTDTPIPFGDTVVQVRYQIPALGLDRRLQGSISSQIIIVDEVTGMAIQRSNQAGVLLDLQQVLPDLLLPVVPEGCDTCVHLTYDLPYAERQGDGWLRDPVLLASLENYFTLSVGPHFPPQTAVGLRRSASAYAPAHSVALMADGTVAAWLASESEVEPPFPADPALTEAMAAFSFSGLADQYVAPCMGAPVESLYLNNGEQDGIVGIICPEYALPTSLLPLYAALDAILADKLARNDDVLVRPPAGLPLTAVLDYQRIDGSRLTLYADGTAVAQPNTGPPAEVTAVLSTTQVLSLTADLIGSGAVRTGLTTFIRDDGSTLTDTEVTATPRPPRSLVLVRGPGGVYDGQWFGSFDVPALQPLNQLLADLLGTATEEPEAEGTAEPGTTPEAGTATPEPEETAVPEPTAAQAATETASPAPSATP